MQRHIVERAPEGAHLQCDGSPSDKSRRLQSRDSFPCSVTKLFNLPIPQRLGEAHDLPLDEQTQAIIEVLMSGLTARRLPLLHPALGEIAAEFGDRIDPDEDPDVTFTEKQAEYDAYFDVKRVRGPVTQLLTEATRVALAEVAEDAAMGHTLTQLEQGLLLEAVRQILAMLGGAR